MGTIGEALWLEFGISVPLLLCVLTFDHAGGENKRGGVKGKGQIYSGLSWSNTHMLPLWTVKELLSLLLILAVK